MKRIVRCILTYLYSFYLKKDKVKIVSSVILSRATIFEGYNVIHNHCNLTDSCIGRGSYIGSNSILPNTRIGRYCSIAKNVKLLSSTHPSKVFVSTSPAFFSLLKQGGYTFTKKQRYEEVLFLDKENQISLEIGNDVWIGEDVKIIGGIRIGDGAIIAAGSVVTKDVDSYSIVGGVPAKHLRSRFSEKDIKFLLNFKWWNQPHSWLEDNVDCFEDIKIFTDQFDEL